MPNFPQFRIYFNLFFSDLGIRNSALGFKQENIAGLLENIVYLELLRNDYTVSIGILSEKEVDFVCDKNDERLYIQVCYIMPNQETAEREFSVLEAILDNHPKYVISMDLIIQNRESGIKHINLIQFLLNGFSS